MIERPWRSRAENECFRHFISEDFDPHIISLGRVGAMAIDSDQFREIIA